MTQGEGEGSDMLYRNHFLIAGDAINHCFSYSLLSLLSSLLLSFTLEKINTGRNNYLKEGLRGEWDKQNEWEEETKGETVGIKGEREKKNNSL